MGEDDGEEEGHEEDDEDTDDVRVDDEDRGEESESHSSSGSMQKSPPFTHCYSDRCCHPCSWAELSKSGNSEDGSLGELSISEES